MDKREKIIFSVISILLIVIVSSKIHEVSSKQKINITEILENASKTKIVSEFLSNGGGVENVTVIFPNELENLSREQPVIYAGLPNKTLYKITYFSGDRGLLIIFDGKKILKHFNVISVRI